MLVQYFGLQEELFTATPDSEGKAKAGKPVTFKSILNTVLFAVIVNPNESLGDLAMQYLGDFDRDRTRQIKNSMLN
jgi:hypothetical protein